ncbi:MAG: MarR family transcriptional regulator [Caulobacteraceae bacterium]
MAKQAKIGLESLRRSPSHLLHLALQYALDLYVQEVGASSITQRQYAVLCAVAAHEGLSQIELVRFTGIDRSTLAQLVGRMIGKGLLGRERSSTDNRINAVTLTEAGRAALDDTQARADAADERVMKAIGRSRRGAFVDALRDLSKAGRSVVGDEPEPSADKPKKLKPGKKLKAERKAGAEKKVGAKKPKKAKPVAVDAPDQA